MEKEIKKLKKSRIRYRITLIIASVMLIIASLVIYLNWDYISFKFFISRYYIHTGALDQLYEDSIGMDVERNYYKYFDNLAISVISEEIRKKADDPYTYQYNPFEYSAYQAWREEKASLAYIEELNADTIYMFLPNFTPETTDFFNKNIDNISLYDNLVLDLRNNGGGDVDAMLKISDTFLEKNDVVIIEKTRTKEKELRSKQNQKLSFNNIIIIQNEYSASASELLILALTENLDNVTTIGSKTYGKSVGQTVMNLLRGFSTRATTLMFLSPEKRESINNIGISPDYEYTDTDILDYIICDIIK